MNPKTILTEDGWDEVAPPTCKGKDKELRSALLFYWSLEDEDFDFRCKALVKIAALAGKFKAAKEVTGCPDKKVVEVAVKHLSDVISASKVKQAELIKAKAEAEKAKAVAAKAGALTQKKAEEEAKKHEEEEGGDEEEEEEEEEQEANSIVKLTKLLKSLRMSKVPYHFLLCDAKPYGLVLCKKNIRQSAPHKKELAKLAGGSTRPPKFGTCRVESGKLIFEMEKPPTGLAGILQKWIKNTTKEKFAKVMVGTESAEDEEEQRVADAGGAAETALPPVSPKLAKAPEAWRATQRLVATGVQQLQAAVRKSLAGEAPALVAEVEEHLTALDGIAEMLGNELPAILKRAIEAKDTAGRNAELKSAKTLLTGYLKYAKGQGAELIAHIDSNPFGVKSNLKTTLTDGLTQMAEAIGTPA
jgi:hypothetical protein